MAGSPLDVDGDEGAAPGEPVTEEDLEEFVDDLEGSVSALVEEVLPAIVEDVAERMAADPWRPAAAAGPAVVATDYSPLVASAFTPGSTATLERVGPGVDAGGGRD